MMFASDLDRTLIFSQRALNDCISNTNNLVAIEKKEGKDLSFMTEEAFSLLQKINEKLLFVPVTTRSIEQFKRISFPFKVPYAITTNGATILHNDRPLIEWSDRIRKDLSESMKIKEFIQIVLNKVPEINGELRIVENLFFYFYLTKPVDILLLNELTSFVADLGWRWSLQGKKLYFIPISISKGRAVTFLKEREGISQVFGAGDSILDLDFLNHCDFPFVPRNSELTKRMNLTKKFIITEQTNILSGEEILKSIWRRFTVN